MRRRLAVWLVGSALFAVTAVLVGCAVTATAPTVSAVKHAPIPAGTACDATGCHTPDYFQPPYTHKEPYLGPCDTCHNTVDWKQIHFTHKNPAFDTGTHAVIGCGTCHTEGKPLPNPACSACHTPPHKGWTSCSSCHTTVAWRLFQSLPKGHVVLTGGHANLVCLDCHKAATEPAHARQCVNCHGTHHGGLTRCQDCHTPTTVWKPSPNWSHSDFFVLRGFHKTLDCAQCHINNRFAGTPKVCVGCHGKHHGGLSDCGACHTTTAFEPPTFRHSSVFALTGAHTKLKCSRCHPDNAFARNIGGGSTRCVACHGPHHGGLTDCADCHTTSSFERTTFRHSSVFPLVGQHATLACSKCHPDDAFARTISNGGTNCVDCHAADNPHSTSIHGLPCETCHTPAGFHLTKPYPGHDIPLGTAHRTMACSLCHPGNGPVFTIPNTTPCVTCHGVGGSANVTIPHTGPSDCLSCHWPTTWADTHDFTHPEIPFSPPDIRPPHDYLDFGPYPAGCTDSCHPGQDFTHFTCTRCHP